jgi:replicative DNA helicase
MLCSEARVNSSKVRSGYLGERDFPKLANAAGRLHDLSIYIDDTPAISVLELRAKARRLVRDRSKKIGLIVVDYLQLMRGMGGASNREQEISEISRSLKALAKKLGAGDCYPSSTGASRIEPRKAADVRPRESGAIEQDADLIMFIYREEVYNKNDEAKRFRRSYRR